MKKTSPLQKILIERINEHCGVKKLVVKLKRYKVGLPVREKMMFENLIQYNQNLYINYVPAEEDFIVYRNSCLKHLDMLDKHIKLTKCEYLNLVRGNIRIGMSTVKDIRILA